MSETTAGPAPSEQPPDPAPRPGVRLAPPGTAPSHPGPLEAPTAEGEQQPAPVSPPPAEETTPKTRRAQARRRRAAASGTGSALGSPEPGIKAKTSSKTYSEPAPAFVEPVQLSNDLTELLLGASESANGRFAPTGTPMFIADREEAAGVARPAARVIARHTPAGLGGPGNPDLADAVAAGITLVRYAVRQIRLWYEIKRMAPGEPAGEAETAAA